MRASQGAEFCREGEGEQVVVTWQEAGAEPFEPCLGPVLLALGAVSVAAGVIGVIEGVAGVTDIEGAAEGGGAAEDDVLDGAEVRGQHASLEGLPESRAGPTEDVAQLYHGACGVASDALDEAVDRIESGVADFTGEMSVDRGGTRAGMAEILLDQLELDAGFKEVGCVGMSKRMNVGALMDAALFQGPLEGFLQAVAADGSDVSLGARLGGLAGSREEADGLVVGEPMLAEEFEGDVGQRYAAVLGTLARHVEHLASAIDVWDLEVSAFHEAQAARVDGDEADAVDGDSNAREDFPDFVAAEHDGELLFLLGPGDIQDRPSPSERLFVEELDAAECDGVSRASNRLDGGQVDEIVADLLLRQLVWGLVEEAGKLGHSLGVGTYGGVGVAAKLEVFDHPLAQGCHDLLLKEWTCTGKDRILQGVFSRRSERECLTYPPQAD